MVIYTILKLFRFKNLLIVSLIQVLLQYLILKPLLVRNEINLLLNNFQFFLMVVCTLILTAAGYVINDIIDQETDLVNKANKVIIGKELSNSVAKLIYITLIITGGIIALLLAFQINHLSWFLIYMFSVLFLYLYSKYLKSIALLGNIIVALFCAGVPFILWFAEQEALDNLYSINPRDHQYILYLFFAYIVYSFITTLIREILKDIEDQLGDKLNNHRTLPILIGLEKSKIVVIFFNLTLALLLVIWIFWDINFNDPVNIILIILCLIFPLLYIIFNTNRATSKTHFSRLSLLSKILMIMGIALIPLYHCL
jgi:4-hydroxybenzoate polyprenyltransferase